MLVRRFRSPPPFRCIQSLFGKNNSGLKSRVQRRNRSEIQIVFHSRRNVKGTVKYAVDEIFMKLVLVI